MKIKNFDVSGLNGSVDFSFAFHDDINILTGVNGSGKTSALKLAWYIVSGNTARIRAELNFKSCRLKTDTFEVELSRERDGDISFKFVDFNDKENVQTGTFLEQIMFDSDGDPMLDGEDNLRDQIRELSDRSIYFPTFRRIEGGYSIPGRFRQPRSVTLRMNQNADLSTQLEALSRQMSSDRHKFVCSISTDDIAALLTERYAQVSEGINKMYTEFSSEILTGIRDWQQQSGVENSSDNLLLQIQKSARRIDQNREATFRPFDVLSNLVSMMFNHQGVRVRSLALGDAAKAIDSEMLSAGEKQMLSFLVYNTFAEDTPIFIDEPELSLHPDWQRRLFPTLLEQQATNQFIVSTHSPFIYAKFSDKELLLNANRGE